MAGKLVGKLKVVARPRFLCPPLGAILKTAIRNEVQEIIFIAT